LTPQVWVMAGRMWLWAARRCCPALDRCFAEAPTRPHGRSTSIRRVIRAVRRCRIAGDKNARAGGWPARITSADRNARRLGDGPPRRLRQSRLDRYATS